MKKFNFGLLAEYVAILIYKIKFYHLLHHRARNYGGEIDLIACRGRQLVFIEVKARTSQVDEHIVSYKQRARIRRSAEIFLSRNPKYHNYEIRFDLVVVRPYKLPIIIKNCW